MPEDAKEAFDFFVEAGWTDAQSAGLVANIEAESNFNFQAVGDGGTAFGLCQWHPDRQRNFQQQFQKNIRDSSFTDQLQFVNFELRLGTEQRAGRLLSQAETAQEAGELVCSQYERPEDPDGHVSRHRGERAVELLSSLQ
jgi:Phage tail lysozyme